ncbi:MAG: RIP metalloprotease RseP [Pelagibacteraceae bacterium TMED136]|nr:MAG: RIP metalloprotease RseP [Pelagibacteraceae bacterium TMED136]|tara:strand:- start:14544 stop:15644 length:1101 start_codon:yes stop_codon:yes gene_type:complete
MLQYILSFIILISIVVFIHEYGHYYFAKKYKVGVTDFSIGFGKELFGFNDKDGTRWKICAIPLGGYVKFFGDSNSASQPTKLSEINEAYHSKLLTTKPLYQRAIIVSAGPIANFLLAIFIFAIIFMTVGKDKTLPIISEVNKNSPALEAGLKNNDQIIFIDNKKIESINDVALFITTSKNKSIKIDVLRNRKELSFTVVPEKKTIKDNFGNKVERKLIGIKIAPLKGQLTRDKMRPDKAIFLSVKETYNTVAMTLSYIGRMIIGQESADQLGGPIKIAQISGKVAEHGLVPFLSIMAYISISLGLINLFPIPLLDGGHLFFYLIEFIRGKPLSDNVQIYFYKFGMFVLFTLMFFATFNDLKSLGFF